MSAFVVSQNTIRAAVAALDSGDLIYLGCYDAQDAGQTLLDENCRSVAYRYSEPQEKIKYTHVDVPATPLESLSAIACIDYQSCETDDWKDTAAYRILQVAKDSAIRSLPGYEDTPWDFPEYYWSNLPAMDDTKNALTAQEERQRKEIAKKEKEAQVGRILRAIRDRQARSTDPDEFLRVCERINTLAKAAKSVLGDLQ
jgi:hypothetical protein